jgi:hypothetical protein
VIHQFRLFERERHLSVFTDRAGMSLGDIFAISWEGITCR